MSARCFDNASCLQTLYKMNEDHFPKSPQIEKQGIVSILSSDFSSNKILSPLHNSSNSIRRTLSAEMSSQKWLQNNGFPQSPVKRAKSSVQLQALGEKDNHDCIGDDENSNKGPALEDVWSSIQADKKSWGCILSPPKNNNDGSGSDAGQVPPPYVHPLAKRTASSLSEKSLEICTESLGSETGSDGFSYPPSEPEDPEHEDVEEEEEEEAETEAKVHNVQIHQVGMGINKSYNNNNNNNNRGPTLTSKRSMMVAATRPSFPPPLPSLGNRDDGSNLHIRSHRQDGRLVVEAVSVPSQNCFRAQRQDGRLLLTFSRCTSEDDHHRQSQLVHDEEEDEVEVEETEYMEEKKVQAVEEQETAVVDVAEHEKGAVMDLRMKRRSCTAMTMMNKFIELSNKSATCPRTYNKTVIKPLNHNHNHNHDKEEEAHAVGVAKQSSPSLPPRPITSTKSTATAALNAYEYYWRRSSSTAVGMLKPLANNNNSNNNNNNNSSNQSEVRKLNPTKRNKNKLLYGAHNDNVKKGAPFSLEDAEKQVKSDGANTGGGRRSGSGAAEYVDVVPWMLRGCKEAKKPSLLLWEPYCIATS